MSPSLSGGKSRPSEWENSTCSGVSGWSSKKIAQQTGYRAFRAQEERSAGKRTGKVETRLVPCV